MIDPAAGHVTQPVTRDVTPAHLGTRGKTLWRDTSEAYGALKPTERALLEEACRTVDRLDCLDAILRGERQAWARLVPAGLDGETLTVKVDGLLSESRQQQLTLKQLLGELRQSRAGDAKPHTGKTKPESDTPKGGAVASVTSLAARIAARAAGAAG